MTMKIVWRPVKDVDTEIDVGAPSAFLDTMGEVGYRLPCTLDSDDRPVMLAMSVIWRRTHDDDTPNPFKQLVDLLDMYDSIDLNIMA